MTFTKAQVASILATGVDFAVTFLMLQLFGLVGVRGMVLAGVTGGAVGTICGGITHFTISRNWVFRAQEGKWAAQVNRYVLVWVGNLVLNVSGLWLMIHFAGVRPMEAKVIVAVTVAVSAWFLSDRW